MSRDRIQAFFQASMKTIFNIFLSVDIQLELLHELGDIRDDESNSIFHGFPANLQSIGQILDVCIIGTGILILL